MSVIVIDKPHNVINERQISHILHAFSQTNEPGEIINEEIKLERERDTEN